MCSIDVYNLDLLTKAVSHPSKEAWTVVLDGHMSLKTDC